MPAFYARPRTIEELVDQTVGRVLDQFGLDVPLTRWAGLKEQAAARDAAARDADSLADLTGAGRSHEV